MIAPATAEATAAVPASAAPATGLGTARAWEPSLWQRLAGIPANASDGWRRRRPTDRERRVDALIGVSIALTLALSQWSSETAGLYEGWGEHTPAWAAIAFPVGYFVAVAMRRTRPMLALVIGTVVFLGGYVVPYRELTITQFAYFALLYSAGAWSRHRTAVTWLRLGITGATIALVAVQAIMMAARAEADADASSANIVFVLLVNLAYYISAYVLGNLDHLRAANADLAIQQARTVAHQREQLAEQAVRLDRLRIARELHDAVAHHVSLMGLQAAVARRSLPERDGTELVREQLEQVEANAREALEELQGILTTLRSVDDAPDVQAGESAVEDPAGDGAETALGADDAPDGGTRAGEASTAAPSTRGIGEVPALIERIRAAGGRAELAVVGEPRPVSMAVGLAAYRTVQEALTNVRKHAGPGARAEVRMRWSDAALEVDVTDDGRLAPAALPGGGRGITGMRERAAAVGGSLEAGPRDGGGFRVRLRVPLARSLPCPEPAAAPATDTGPGSS